MNLFPQSPHPFPLNIRFPWFTPKQHHLTLSFFGVHSESPFFTIRRHNVKHFLQIFFVSAINTISSAYINSFTCMSPTHTPRVFSLISLASPLMKKEKRTGDITHPCLTPENKSNISVCYHPPTLNSALYHTCLLSPSTSFLSPLHPTTVSTNHSSIPCHTLF